MGNNAYKDLERLVRCASPWRCWRIAHVFTGANGRPVVGVGEATYVSFVAGTLQNECSEDGCAR